MNMEQEINRGYVDHVRGMNQQKLGLPAGNSAWSLRDLKFDLAFRGEQVLTLLGLMTLALWLEVWLRAALLFRRSKPSQLNQAAIDNVEKFVEQYPFHL